jgi:FAD/FMN-containing dehydrogenase
MMSRFSRRAVVQGAAASAIAAGTIGRDTVSAMNRGSFNSTTANRSALDDLRSRLNGTLMLPGDSGFDSASAPANGRYLNIRPLAVARVADEADVVTCVQWCNENGVSPVARGGGHSYAGFSTTNGLLVDLRRLNSVAIDNRAGSAICGGAATNGDFFTAYENGSHFLPGGTCLGVGVGGLVLGGGIGYNAHWAGLTCDHLTASRIVTADGELREIDASSDADLFWACRGGAGGSFGINTQFSFNLVEVPTAPIGYFRFDWTGADAAQAVFEEFHTLLTKAPAALNAVAMAEATEVGSDGPREAIHVMSRGQYIGPLDELKDLVKPLLDAATPDRQVLEAIPYWQMQRMIASAEPEPHSFGDISRYAAEPLPSNIVSELVELLVECPSRSEDENGSIWSLGWVGGDVINAYARTDTAYVHRGALTLLRPTTVWANDTDPGVVDALNAWTAAVIQAIEPATMNESYQNFPNRDIVDWQQQYYAENWERLVEVKTTYDPGDLFRNPQSIPPE